MDIDFLFELLSTSGVSGNERDVAKLCESYLSDKCEISYDKLGNLFATINNGKNISPKNKLHILIDAHIDEIGLQVTYIDNEGYLFVRPCGGIDIITLIGSYVDIQCSNSEEVIRGVIGRKPIHLIKGDEKGKVPDIDRIWVDTGLNSEEVRAKVCIGDYVTPCGNTSFLGENRIASKAIDNRIGAFILTQLANSLSSTDKVVTLAFTTQEELGCKGAAAVAANNKNYDYAICLDAAFSSDVPDISPQLVGNIRLGNGPVLYRNGDTNQHLYNYVKDLADSHGINVQISAGHAASGGTNTRNLQLFGAGMKTITIGYPVRYMHTPVGLADITDIENLIRLLYCIVNNCK